MIRSPAPTVAIVGRPNVGKSTLFNRITGSRRAIVGNEPGITRDRISLPAQWDGKPFELIDTGGILVGEEAEIPSQILKQARAAIDRAWQIIFLVDGRTEITGADRELARLLLQTGRPVVLAVNKIDAPSVDSLVSDFYQLGFSRVCPVSAEHNRGVAELLDETTADFPARAIPPEPQHPGSENSASSYASRPGVIQVAIIGKPNAGKSTLLNRLAGQERAIVSAVPGTTRDAVDAEIERAGVRYRFVDTAGIRAKGKTRLMAEKLAVVMARRHIRLADVVVLLIDGIEGITALDSTIAGYAHDSGKPVVIVVNKWDIAGHAERPEPEKVSGREIPGNPTRIGQPGRPGRLPPGKQVTLRAGVAAAASLRSARVPSHRAAGRNGTTARVNAKTAFTARIRDKLKFLDYAPITFVSALTGASTEHLFPLVRAAFDAAHRRVPTGELNRFFASLDLGRAPVPAGKTVKILYLTQASVAPPTFVLFTDRFQKLHFSFERFLINQLRRSFDFSGTPIVIRTRPRRSK